MKPIILDSEDMQLIQSINDTMGINMDGELFLKIGDNMALDMDSGEMHFTFGWPNSDDDD